LQITPVHIEKEIDSSDNISKLISQSAKLNDGDILVIAQKIISKQEGRVVALSTVTPSLLAQGIGSQYHKDPRVVELILSESKRIVRMKNEIIFVQMLVLMKVMSKMDMLHYFRLILIYLHKKLEMISRIILVRMLQL
jgi:F420-0:gamma-glutamyl ligase